MIRIILPNARAISQTRNSTNRKTTMHTIDTCTLRFPNLQLPMREAARLRGYFGNCFREHSPLLHNHYADGGLRYRYPLVQYKVVKQVPTLMGLQEGAPLLRQLFLQVGALQIGERSLPVESRDLDFRPAELGVDPAGLHTYHFSSPWLGLNERNFQRYQQASPAAQQKLLQGVLTGNILSCYKGLGLRLGPEERILLTADLKPLRVQFKNQPMLGFKGSFTTNALLPHLSGLGKAVSRGFGTLQTEAASEKGNRKTATIRPEPKQRGRRQGYARNGYRAGGAEAAGWQ